MNYSIVQNEPSESRLEGSITRLIPEKKAGWIAVPNNIRDFYFVKNQLIGVIFEHLSVGDKVSFIPFHSPDRDLSFANKITLITTNSNHDKRIIGVIKRIDKEQNYGFIEVDDNNADRYFKAEEIVNKNFSDLEVGDRVSFIERLSKQNSRFANKIIALDEKDSKFLTHQSLNNENPVRYNGFIRKLITEKYSGWVVLENQQEEIYFVSKQLQNVEYQNLKINDKISCEIGFSSDGKKFANRILFISHEIKDNSGNENSFIHERSVIKEENFRDDNLPETISHQVIQIFSDLQYMTNPFVFENSVFLLLRCLGIHSLYQYDAKNQAGRGDGFFTIGNLAVIYDCTLRENFEDFKKDQIENYVHKIDQSQINFELKKPNGSTYAKTVRIAGKNRQVWIITKGKSREISDYGSIKVKEIGVSDLVWLLSLRLQSDVLEEEDLSLNFLSCLEKINIRQVS